ncbi:MAG TPA: biotin/lipoyl-containing protein [Gemmatimonadales bacterium]|nr:biotin/lipoyl-containing protein [Gemmatimonadales bacterium]
MKYFVTVGERTVEVQLDGDRVTIDGVVSVVHREPVIGTPLQQVMIDGRAFTLSLESDGPGRWVAGVRGSRYDVAVVDERTHHVQQLVGPGAAPSGQALKAPMPGLVVRVLVAEGDQVATGQGLVVLEAMKMENELKATGTGVVMAVRAMAGATVEKGQLLLEVGPASVS